jgi:hypothetical protein
MAPIAFSCDDCLAKAALTLDRAAGARTDYVLVSYLQNI